MRGLWVCLALLPACDWLFQLEPRPKWTVISAGSSHTCGIQDTDALYCWGKNAHGQLGDGTLRDRLEPEQVEDDLAWRAVSAGAEATCAITTDGALWCWGDNRDGQLGQGNRLAAARPLRVGLDNDWRQIAIGAVHACAIRADGSLWCWGADDNAALGNGPIAGDELLPYPVLSDLAWSQVAVSGHHTCAIATNGTLWCWGINAANQVGVPGAVTYEVPTQVTPDTDWIAVSTSAASAAAGPLGATHTCAVRATGTTMCWGPNAQGQGGISPTTSTRLATPMMVSQSFVAIAAGGEHTCGLTADNQLACWGRDERGQLGIGLDTGASYSEPQRAPGTFAAVATGESHTCAIDLFGQLWCTGTSAHGELGDGTGATATPQRIGDGFTDVDVGFEHVCASKGQEVWCWGKNRAGQLADASLAPTQVPTHLAPTGQVAAGGEQTCALANGALECWGFPIGNDVAMASATPARVARQWQHVEAGQHTCAIEAGTDALFCWGPNQFGQLGDGTLLSRFVPARVGALFYKQVAPSRDFTCAVQTTDQVMCWGAAAQGQLGDNNTNTQRRPTPGNVLHAEGGPSLVARSVTTGGHHACAVTAQSSLYCWGNNQSSQLGLGNTSGRLVATQVAGTWSMASAGDHHTCGIDTTGALYCWGGNSAGQLGDGSYVDRSQPSLIMPELRWSTVDVANDQSCAVTADAELYCWGLNDFGQLGTNNAWRVTFGLVRNPAPP